ncbi:MAG: glycoside hydrolase family 36 protein [Actinomycetes bacterium]
MVELRSETVVVELHEDGTFSAGWPVTGHRIGPVRALVAMGGFDAAVPGPWHLDGTVARAGGLDSGPGATLTLEPTGFAVRVDLTPSVDEVVDRFTLTGPFDLDATATLVEGYDSWSYAGVRRAEEPTRSWWRTALVGPAGALTVSARTGERCATAIDHAAGTLRVDSAGAPTLTPIDGSWGYTTSAPDPLGLPVAAGRTVVGETVAFSSSPDPLAAVEADAAATGAAMGARRWDGPPILGWESWYHFGLTVEPGHVLANATALREVVADPRFDLVQIDDGWQQTYGAWWSNERWPSDLGTVVRDLAARGCRAGLWLAPFMVVPGAPGLGTEHPEWCIGDPAGDQPLRERHGRWMLDATHPEVLDFLRGLCARVRDWGFEMVKLDFLYGACQTGRRHDPSITGVEALRLGLRAFVEGLGSDRYVLGCGMPLLPAVGICHGNRIGHDTATPRVYMEFGHPTGGWTGWTGVVAQARNVAARWALHRRWFDCDPDIVMAWGADGADPAGYSPDEARVLATLGALCGGPCFLADDLGPLDATGRATLADPAFAARAWGDGFRPLDLFDQPDDAAGGDVFSTPTALAEQWTATRDGQDRSARFDWVAHRVD